MTTSTDAPVPDATSPDARKPVIEIVGEVADDYITELQRGYRDDRSTAVALLAQLRRGAGKLPQDVPELWGLAGLDRLYQRQDLSEAEAVRAEAALFITFTLYALHQQSRPEHGMHRRGVDFGAAVRRLMGDGIDEPIRRRFVRAGTAATLPSLAYRLREIVTLLRRESIPLDYARLARQLYQAQRPGGPQEVRRQWGRSFHVYRSPHNPEPEGSGGSGTTGDAATDKETE